MTLTVYLAGPYAARDQLRGYAEELRRIGYRIGTRWLEETHEIGSGTVGPATDLDDTQAERHAFDDLADVDKCDVFVGFTAAVADMVGGTGNSGGRHVELGYALAASERRIVIVGEPEHIFHRIGWVTKVPDWHAAVVHLSTVLVEHHENAPRGVVA